MNFDARTRYYGIGILKAEDRRRVSLSKFINTLNPMQPNAMTLRRILIVLFLFGSMAVLPAAAQQTQGVYVANQGNFSDNNGSITYYDPATGETVEVLADFGTLVQSITLYDGKGYVMSNTSGAVDVLDLATQQRIAQIQAVSSPRYMTVADASKAYVSNLFDGTVTVINLTDGIVQGTVDVGSNPEDVAVLDGRVFVANSGFGGDSTLTVIDAQTNTALETINLGCDGPRHLEVDAEGELWAFCIGNTVYNDDFTQIIAQTNGAVVVLDGATGEVVTRFDLDFQVGAASLGQDTYFSAASAEIFLVHGTDLLVFDTAANTQQGVITLPGDEGVGGIAYDATAQRLYAARIIDFTTTGFVSIHSRDGQEVARFDAGIAPGHVALLQADVGTAVEQTADAVPERFGLRANYPNPFNPTTTLPFDVTQAGPVTLTIYDLLGRPVATLIDAPMTPGRYEVAWDAGGLPSGVYLSRLATVTGVSTRRLVLLK